MPLTPFCHGGVGGGARPTLNPQFCRHCTHTSNLSIPSRQTIENIFQMFETQQNSKSSIFSY